MLYHLRAEQMRGSGYLDQAERRGFPGWFQLGPGWYNNMEYDLQHR